MSDEETGDETIGDVLTRTSKLLKDDMIKEVEAYGMEVNSSWTKDEIMENFEQFLTEQAEQSDVEEPDVVEEQDVGEPEVLPPLDLPPTPSPPPPPAGPPPQSSQFPPTSNVRIMRSPGWGKTGGAKAP